VYRPWCQPIFGGEQDCPCRYKRNDSRAQQENIFFQRTAILKKKILKKIPQNAIFWGNMSLEKPWSQNTFSEKIVPQKCVRIICSLIRLTPIWLKFPRFSCIRVISPWSSQIDLTTAYYIAFNNWKLTFL
jgi:hypothetical protein